MVLSGNFVYRDENGKMKHIPNADTLAKTIVDTINFYQNDARESRKKANKTREEVMEAVRDEMRQKDEALARAPFIFTKVEDERYTNFMRAHYLKGCNCNKGYSISFVGTGVGTSFEMICNDCGEREDITDVESW